MLKMHARDTITALGSAGLLFSTAALLLLASVASGEVATSNELFQGRNSPFSQQPLGGKEQEGHGDRFTKKLQDNSTCPTYGESQWTGTVTVGEGRDLFYWYFDSRNDPENDPVIIWMSGGPGGSSMLGLFIEMGPCWLEANRTEPRPNQWSWNNNASVLFLDQPAGTGFSHLADGLATPVTEEDTAQDFQQFLNIFFSEVFPDKRNLPIHIATASYGGHYGPVYLNHIIQSRRYDSHTAFWGNITSLILIDGLIDFTGTFVGSYEMLCQNREEGAILNATACEDMARNLPEQERLGRSCQLAYKAGAECTAAYEHGDKVIHAAFMDLVKAGKRHPANIHKKCTYVPSKYPGCADPTLGDITAYLNLNQVKEALEKPTSFEFQDINRVIWDAFANSGAFWKPTTRELASVLDEHANEHSVADIRVMVINGNLDWFINTPGNIWQYDRIGWSGQAEYRIKKWESLPEGMAATGSWKSTSDGRLAFLGVNEAGHTLPADVMEGSYHMITEWLRGGWRM